jgi:quercetin dioxygenase-like cupin family protein
VTERRVVWMPGGVRTEVHLTRADTGGAFCLLADEPPPGWSLPPHRHRNESETIHVIAGTFEMTVDGDSRTLRAGDTVHVPAGVVHSGGNVGDAAGRRIVMFSPAGLERFFLEVGAAEPEAAVDITEALAGATRHGWEFVG